MGVGVGRGISSSGWKAKRWGAQKCEGTVLLLSKMTSYIYKSAADDLEDWQVVKR